MSKEFSGWLERTSKAIEETREPRQKLSNPRLSVEQKRDLLRQTLTAVVQQWSRLDVDGILSDVASFLNLEVRNKRVFATYQNLEPKETLIERVLKSANLSNEDARTIQTTGIEVDVSGREDDSDTFFSLFMDKDHIGVASTQPDPKLPMHGGCYIAVHQDLGKPELIKDPEIFRDRLDGFLENLIRNYPSFYPKGNRK